MYPSCSNRLGKKEERDGGEKFEEENVGELEKGKNGRLKEAYGSAESPEGHKQCP